MIQRTRCNLRGDVEEVGLLERAPRSVIAPHSGDGRVAGGGVSHEELVQVALETNKTARQLFCEIESALD